MDITYEHSHTVPYDFDPQNVTDAAIRQVIARHYDFSYWCERNTQAPYQVHSKYSPLGITVSFESERDHMKFLEFTGNNYWIFLHN